MTRMDSIRDSHIYQMTGDQSRNVQCYSTQYTHTQQDPFLREAIVREESITTSAHNREIEKNT